MLLGDEHKLVLVEALSLYGVHAGLDLLLLEGESLHFLLLSLNHQVDDFLLVLPLYTGAIFHEGDIVLERLELRLVGIGKRLRCLLGVLCLLVGIGISVRLIDRLENLAEGFGLLSDAVCRLPRILEIFLVLGNAVVHLVLLLQCVTVLPKVGKLPGG